MSCSGCVCTATLRTGFVIFNLDSRPEQELVIGKECIAGGVSGMIMRSNDKGPAAGEQGQGTRFGWGGSNSALEDHWNIRGIMIRRSGMLASGIAEGTESIRCAAFGTGISKGAIRAGLASTFGKGIAKRAP